MRVYISNSYKPLFSFTFGVTGASIRSAFPCKILEIAHGHERWEKGKYLFSLVSVTFPRFPFLYSTFIFLPKNDVCAFYIVNNYKLNFSTPSIPPAPCIW